MSRLRQARATKPCGLSQEIAKLVPEDGSVKTYVDTEAPPAKRSLHRLDVP
jgi:hypothetical protein